MTELTPIGTDAKTGNTVYRGSDGKHYIHNPPLPKLDVLEQRFFDHHTKNGMSPVDALRVIFNTVEGDWSQLSVGLRGYAEKMGWMKDWEQNPVSRPDYEEALAGEGWAIADYQAMLADATPEEAVVIKHIIEEEKEHLQELLAMKQNPGLPITALVTKYGTSAVARIWDTAKTLKSTDIPTLKEHLSDLPLSDDEWAVVATWLTSFRDNPFSFRFANEKSKWGFEEPKAPKPKPVEPPKEAGTEPLPAFAIEFLNKSRVVHRRFRLGERVKKGYAVVITESDSWTPTDDFNQNYIAPLFTLVGRKYNFEDAIKRNQEGLLAFWTPVFRLLAERFAKHDFDKPIGDLWWTPLWSVNTPKLGSNFRPVDEGKYKEELGVGAFKDLANTTLVFPLDKLKKKGGSVIGHLKRILSTMDREYAPGAEIKTTDFKTEGRGSRWRPPTARVRGKDGTVTRYPYLKLLLKEIKPVEYHYAHNAPLLMLGATWGAVVAPHLSDEEPTWNPNRAIGRFTGVQYYGNRVCKKCFEQLTSQSNPPLNFKFASEEDEWGFQEAVLKPKPKSGWDGTWSKWLIGKRVVRGPTWKWDDQDGGKEEGVIIKLDGTTGWVNVTWETAGENSYRMGKDSKGNFYQDLEFVGESNPPPHFKFAGEDDEWGFEEAVKPKPKPVVVKTVPPGTSGLLDTIADITLVALQSQRQQHGGVGPLFDTLRTGNDVASFRFKDYATGQGCTVYRFTARSKSSGEDYNFEFRHGECRGEEWNFGCSCRGWTQHRRRECKHTKAFKSIIQNWWNRQGGKK
jgi:hypothetical protein